MTNLLRAIHAPSAAALVAALLALAGCVVQAPPPRVVYVAPAPAPYVPPPAPPATSVYIEPPLVQPEPVLIGWAPPAMLVEVPPPIPFPGAIWIGGYWGWRGNWVWASGRWATPPQPSYLWVHPYYENRGGNVIFIGGHWAAQGVVFVPPPPSLNLSVSLALGGVIPGPRPIGPPGVFVPAPPGSRPGLIVPAPIGTPPAVVIGAPPVVNVGMRITSVGTTAHVGIVAPATATASGRAFEAQAPTQAHLAAAQVPVVRAVAPAPAAAPTARAESVPARQAPPAPTPESPAPPAATAPTQPPTATAAPAATKADKGDKAARKAAKDKPAKDKPAKREPRPSREHEHERQQN